MEKKQLEQNSRNQTAYLISFTKQEDKNLIRLRSMVNGLFELFDQKQYSQSTVKHIF